MSDYKSVKGRVRQWSVERLRHRHAANAAASLEEAFKTNIAHEYEDNTPDARPPSKLARTLRLLYSQLELHFWIFRNRIILTTTESPGDAIVKAYRPGELLLSPKDPIEKLLKRVERILTRFTRSPEQRKRTEERELKTVKLAIDVLGPNVTQEFWILYLLGTRPAAQGHGYGGALVDAVTALADSTGHPCLLISTDVKNNSFYELHGFVTKGEFFLGDANPTWREAPIVCSLMVRDNTGSK